MGKICVLVCPLDWGLGHASRCVPVIREFLKADCRVVVAASGPGAALIKREIDLPGSIEFVPFPGFSVSYSGSLLFLRLMLQVPSFLLHIYREKKFLRQLVSRFSPNLIISDNRYGLVHETVPSVIITHQLRPALPSFLKIFELPLSFVIRRMVRAFDECWIPDYKDCPAAGNLVYGWQKLPAVYFTGWLSRFSCGSSDPKKTAGPASRYRVMYLLSGVEPQRSMLEEKIIRSRFPDGQPSLLVRGLPDGTVPAGEERGLEIVPFLDSKAIREAVAESELIVCRSGYSSVTDLLALGRRAVLVPTPGQTEQEYLGRWLAGKGWFDVVRQKDFDVLKLYDAGPSVYGGSSGPPEPGARLNLLAARVNGILQKIRSEAEK